MRFRERGSTRSVTVTSTRTACQPNRPPSRWASLTCQNSHRPTPNFPMKVHGSPIREEPRRPNETSPADAVENGRDAGSAESPGIDRRGGRGPGSPDNEWQGGTAFLDDRSEGGRSGRYRNVAGSDRRGASCREGKDRSRLAGGNAETHRR